MSFNVFTFDQIYREAGSFFNVPDLAAKLNLAGYQVVRIRNNDLSTNATMEQIREVLTSSS